jgi:heptosyltransferase-2
MLNTFKKTYTLPFKYDIPHYTQEYLDTTTIFKRFSKFFRRYLYIALNGHLSLEQNEIKKNHKNILWINLSAPSLGDSLMDLSSRVLLEDKNIDLFTDIKNTHIYKSDKIFKNIITDVSQIDKNKYDLVIIDSYGTKGLKTKFNYLSDLPFVGMYGYYNGPELNRVLYSFHRMNQLLGYKKSEDEINTTAKVIMYISSEDEELINSIKLPSNFITIAIGGEWDYRTYNSWAEVISNILKNNPQQNIVLIGSSNAKDEELKLLKKFKDSNIISLVAKYSFNQTVQIIKKSQVLLCCDGGLMHSANSVNTTIIPLFAHLTPQMQLTSVIKAYPIDDKTDVNNISVDEVIQNYKQYLEEN